MRAGTLDITLRPIKLAFIADISDKEAVLEAIRINSFLWGGLYNPIIPFFERKPKFLAKDILFKLQDNADILRGYLNAYDPDYVVQLGKCKDLELDLGGREKIKAEDILSGISDDGTVRYGIGIYEVLNHFYEKELKFVRKNPVDVVIPKLAARSQLFMASVFGDLPEKFDKEFLKGYEEPFSIKRPVANLTNYHTFLDRKTLFLRRFTGLYVDSRRRGSRFDDHLLYLLDPNNVIDVVDYWNLRALGLTVIPVPIQVAETSEMKSFCEKFVDESFGQHRYNPQIYYTATVQKGRSVSEEKAKAFLKFLDIKPDSKSGQSKISARFWYPRIWDSWARDKDGAEGADLEADNAQKDLPSDQDSIEFKTLTPEFLSRFGGHGWPRFANEIELRTYAGENAIAEVMPQGDSKLANRIGGYGHKEWRLSRKGLVYLSQHSDWTVHLPLPEAEVVFLDWIKSLGWETKISSAGYIAKQLIKHLGGVWGIETIANEELIGLLGRLTGQNRLLSSLSAKIVTLEKILRTKQHDDASKDVEKFLLELDEARTSSELKEGPILKDQLIAEISKAISKDPFKNDPVKYLERLTDINMFRLGTRIQCPVCQRHSWYSLDELKYELQCPKCLENFKPPTHSPTNEMQWAYRTFGPFSLPDLASGGYSVLITLRFFSKLLDGAVTPSMSFLLKKGIREFEVDLGMLFSWSKFSSSTVIPIFCECKSFWDKFEEKGIKNMEYLGQQTPGAILVFSTFRHNLDKSEVKFLSELIKRNRNNRKARKPFNQILILTGTELFSQFGPPDCWENGTAEQKKFAKQYNRYEGIDELSDITQQMYLGFKPWHEEEREHYENKRAKKLAVKESKDK